MVNKDVYIIARVRDVKASRLNWHRGQNFGLGLGTLWPRPQAFGLGLEL